MKSHQLRKWANVLALIGIFMFAGAALFQLQIAFGWNNPAANPPNGNGMMGVSATGQGWMGPPGTTASGTAMLTINGSISSSKVTDLIAPINGQDAANKAYVDAQVGGGGGTGGGSLILYYREVTNAGGTTAPPTCPTGWTQQYAGPGYGPRYIGVLNYGWLTSSGGQGGFGGTAPPSSPPPASGSSYTLNSVAIASDSVCSSDQTTIVPFSSFYQNSFQTNFSSHNADACYTDTTVTPNVTTCNRCVVCQK